jgi:hypothetical protein
MKKLLVGAGVVFGTIIGMSLARAALATPFVHAGTAPGKVVEELGKARYDVSQVPGNVRVIFAYSGLSGSESALYWARKEQGQNRVVLVSTDVLDQLPEGTALYSFASLDAAKEALKGDFWVLPRA